MTRSQVLVVDDKEAVTELVARILQDAYDVTATCDPREAMRLLEQREFDLVLSDVRMPGASGFDVLAAVRRRAVGTSVVLMTGYASIPDAVAAMRQGAFDYVAKPAEVPELQLVVARAIEDRARRAAAEARGDGAVDTGFHEAILVARHRASHDYLVALMRQFHGNVTRAAAKAGMTRESLHRLLRQYGVRSEHFKSLLKQPAG
jgi:DNA-binding NtrC family response regulator